MTPEAETEGGQRYDDVDYTERTYTHPDVLGVGVSEGWADPETDPTRINWDARRAQAAIPFCVVDGRPVNPFGPTGIRYGRNELGHWGEALAADALVAANDRDGHRWIVMIERKDGHGWALPGGFVDPGENAVDAVGRELFEETGLDVGDVVWDMSAPRYVPDPRASDEAWMVTVLAKWHISGDFPPVVGADDAARAAWVRADNYVTLTDYIARSFRGDVFQAHRDMLREALDS